MRAVGRDEVDDRLLVPQVSREIDPARVGRELRVAGHGEELGARLVERRHAGVAAAGDVDRRQIERQADQVVAQRLGDELVDLVADRAGQAAHDGAGRSSALTIRRVAGHERQRIQERRDQADLLVAGRQGIGVADDVEVGIEAVHGLGQHRVAEAIDHVRELGDDRRVERGVVDLAAGEEQIHLRLHRARELLEHQMLVLHLGGEAGGLEQALAVPRAVGKVPLGDEVGIVRSVDHVLDMLDQPVVLGVEDEVDGGQADVLVAAAVAGDEVGVEQLVVVRGLALRVDTLPVLPTPSSRVRRSDAAVR